MSLARIFYIHYLTAIPERMISPMARRLSESNISEQEAEGAGCKAWKEEGEKARDHPHPELSAVPSPGFWQPALPNFLWLTGAPHGLSV